MSTERNSATSGDNISRLMGLWGIHPGLRAGGRLPSLARDEASIRTAEWAVWIVLGASAACCSALPEFHWRLPGHAILRAIFPMALGLALAPRRGGGGVMGVTSLLTAFVLRFGGISGIGFGAITSLVLCGPMLDLALWTARRGARLYFGIVAAGLTTNVVALFAKAAEKKFFAGGGGGRSFGSWLLQAIWTYPLFGILAGLISAAVWFRWRSRETDFSRGPIV